MRPEIDGHLLLVRRIALFELLENANFNLASVAVLGYCAYNLDSDSLIGVGIDCFDHLAERALTKESHCTVSMEVSIVV